MSEAGILREVRVVVPEALERVVKDGHKPSAAIKAQGVSPSDVVTGKAAQNMLASAGDSAGRAIAAAKNATNRALREKRGYTPKIRRAKGVLRDFAARGIEIDGIKIDEVDMSRIPRLYDNSRGILPDYAAGGYASGMNIEALNDIAFSNKLGENGLYEIVSHEGFHGYLANLRVAWATQKPEEYQQALLDVIANSVRSGETGKIFHSGRFEHSPKEILAEGISKELPDNGLVPKDKHAELLGEFFLKEDKYITRQNKYDKPRLTEKAAGKIKGELAPFMEDQSPEAQERLVEQVAGELPELYALKSKLIEAMQANILEMKFIKPPELSVDERAHVADFVADMLKNKERFTKQAAEYEPVELTDEARHMIDEKLMPHLADFVGKKAGKQDASEKIAEYIQAQANRHRSLIESNKYTAGNGKLPSIAKPLTESEIALARKAVENDLSCKEGNLRLMYNMQKGIPPSEDMFMQYMFNWEEMQARRVSFRYVAQVLDEKIAGIEESLRPNNIWGHMELKKMKKIRDGFRSNLTLLDLVEKKMQMQKSGADAAKIAIVHSAIQDVAPKCNMELLPSFKEDPLVKAIDEAFSSGNVKEMRQPARKRKVTETEIPFEELPPNVQKRLLEERLPVYE